MGKNKFKIEIQGKKLDKSAMFMHTQIASMKVSGVKMTVNETMPGHSIVLNVGEFKNGHRYLIDLESIIRPLVDFHFGEGKKIKVAEIPTIPKPKT